MKKQYVLLGVAIFSIMVTYDILSAANTYLHLARFNETFKIGDLKKTENLMDFLAKIFAVYSLYMVVLFLSVMLTRVITGTSPVGKHKNMFIELVNEALRSAVEHGVAFFGVYIYWIHVRYESYNDIHRAITFPLIFIICRALYIVGLLLGHAIDFLYLSYIPLLMNILLEIVIVIESHHIPIINKIC